MPDRTRWRVAGILALAAVPTAEMTAEARSSTLPDDLSAILYIYADGSHRRGIDLAMEIVIVRCMEEAGFEYVPPSRPPADTADEILNGPIGLTDGDRAAEYGYTAPEDSDPPIQPQMSTDPAFMRALAGPSWDAAEAEMIEIVDPVTGEVIAGQERREGGCVGEAEAAVYGDEAVMLRFFGADYRLQNLGVESVVRTLSDDAVVDANAEWSGCMSLRGYQYSAAVDPLNAPWPEPRPGDTEVATAIADVECKSDADLLSEYRSVLQREAEILEGENVGVLEEWTRLYNDIRQRISELET